jgi:hypothetical protein
MTFGNLKSLPLVGILVCVVLWWAFVHLPGPNSASHKTGGCAETCTLTKSQKFTKNLVLAAAIIATLFFTWKSYDVMIHGANSLSYRQRISRSLKPGSYADKMFDRMTLPSGRGQSAPRVSGRGDLI